MKTKYYFSLLIVTSLLTFSCKDKEETETAESSTSGAPKEIIMPRVQPLQVATTPNITQVPGQTPQTATTQAVPPPPAAKGMNPAHGQPGHRCDIAVGAPLNSPKGPAPAKATGSAPYTITQTPTSTTTSVPAATTPAILNPDAATTPTAPGMNPPHGQAGHKCGVAVGAPLPK